LRRTFESAPAGKVKSKPWPEGRKGRLTLGFDPAPAAARPPDLAGGREFPVAISYPLPGDRFLLEPQKETVRLTLKAECRAPVKSVTWFLNGREAGAPGPPYDLPLEMPRGRHRVTVAGPHGWGDSVEIVIQ
jgi:hypothetical protein